MMTPAQKIQCLRNWMLDQGISAFIIPSTDPHAGEYVPERWKAREWISGFNGSAGTAVVTTQQAALWTDSRYFIAAEQQLKGSGFALMKERIEGTPTIAEWLISQLPAGAIVAVDGWVNTVDEVEALRLELQVGGLQLCTHLEPFEELWTNRPAIPQGKVFIQDLAFAGETTTSKLSRIRRTLGNQALLVANLEEIAWTLNLRCDDILYTPFLVSYLLIEPTQATLFICGNKVTEQVALYLQEQGVQVKAYEAVTTYLSDCTLAIQCQPEKTNYAVFSAIGTPVCKPSPISPMLMIKNETEIKGFRSAMMKDGIAMVKWMKWTLEQVPLGKQTELSLAAKLEQFRSEQPLYKGPSFESIMGYAHHGAIVHYEPTSETDIPVRPEGLLLIDSGGQYLDGTTDITRTLPLGPLTEEMERDYTLVLRGWINLGRAVFPKGTCGTQLDALARQPMWQYGINYLHGTGHGVGQFMSVHETIDQHQFRMQWRPTPLQPGMTITCEPGIYIEGSHGVRHENTMLVVEADFSTPTGRSTEYGAQPCDGKKNNQGIIYGPYYTFEHLTLCPILTSAIRTEMLTAEEKNWFNQYQQTVFDRLSPYLDAAHQEWLLQVTRPI